MNRHVQIILFAGIVAAAAGTAYVVVNRSEGVQNDLVPTAEMFVGPSRGGGDFNFFIMSGDRRLLLRGSIDDKTRRLPDGISTIPIEQLAPGEFIDIVEYERPLPPNYLHTMEPTSIKVSALWRVVSGELNVSKLKVEPSKQCAFATHYMAVVISQAVIQNKETNERHQLGQLLADRIYYGVSHW